MHDNVQDDGGPARDAAGGGAGSAGGGVRNTSGGRPDGRRWGRALAEPVGGAEQAGGLPVPRREPHAEVHTECDTEVHGVRTHGVLTGLGYSAGNVQSYQDGPEGLGFLVDAAPLCLEGTMHSGATRANAFGGYPDHSGCDVPSGGH